MKEVNIIIYKATVPEKLLSLRREAHSVVTSNEPLLVKLLLEHRAQDAVTVRSPLALYAPP